jgi:ABC-type multidrug transport system fused ATPase/permease subunit
MLLLAWLLSAGHLEGAFAVVLYNYHSRLGNKVIYTIMSFSDFTIGLKTSYARISSLISSREFPKETFGSVHVEDVKGEIVFQNVTFSYNKHGSLLHAEKPVLKNISFIVKPGQTAALVGSSGCGKSTIFKLLNKQYTPNEGLILLDGTELDLLDEDSLRGSIALINQYPYLFNASIRQNLAYVKPDMSDEEMIDVCKKACIHDDIMNMENGYDTELSEGGADLSGGQKQRLAIARGLLRNPPVLLLDEATSALDNTTQSQVMTSIKGIQGHKTVLLIAHRLSSITYADIIFMIREGKVWAHGTHRELMENCAEYRELYLAEQAGTES